MGAVDEEEEEEEESTDDMMPAVSSAQRMDAARRMGALPEGLPDFVYDTTLDPKTRARLIEQEMNEQAQTVEVLKTLGASQTTIEGEQRKFEELEAAVFHDFRQDIMKKIKRQSVKATAIKDKLGLGYRPAATAATANTHMRSKSMSQAAAFLSTKRHSSRDAMITRHDPSKISELFEEASEKDVDSATSKGFIPGHQRTKSFDTQLLRQKRHKTPSPRTSQSTRDGHFKDNYQYQDSSSSEEEVELLLSKSVHQKKR